MDYLFLDDVLDFIIFFIIITIFFTSGDPFAIKEPKIKH